MVHARTQHVLRQYLHVNSEGCMYMYMYDLQGAAVMNMLKGVAGDAVTKTALNAYLQSHAYGNAEAGDLWSAFDKVRSRRGGAS